MLRLHSTLSSHAFPYLPFVLLIKKKSVLLSSRRAFSAMGGATRQVDTSQRLAALRGYMQNNSPKIDAFVIPSEDARKSYLITRHASFNDVIFRLQRVSSTQ